MDGGGDGVVTALAGIDMVIGQHLNPSLDAQMCDDFVHVHIGASARACLIHINEEGICIFTCNNCFCCANNGLGTLISKPLLPRPTLPQVPLITSVPTPL